MTCAATASPSPPPPAGVALSRDDYDRFLPFVRRTAMRMARRAPPAVSVGDLVGSGLVGLVDALAKAGPETSRDTRDAYLVYRIRGAMLDYVANADDRTRDACRASRRLVREIGRLVRALGRDPDEDEIAAAMDLGRDAYRALLATLDELGLARLEVTDLDPALDDAGAGPPSEGPSAPLDLELAAAVARLPEPLQLVLALRHQEQCNTAEIALVLDLDERRVVELHAEIIHRLRAALVARAS
jgi:RNA polymerase sigma factor for flagellar operon FliA